MKRIVALMMAVIFALGLTACGKEEPPSPPSSVPDAPSSSETVSSAEPEELGPQVGDLLYAPEATVSIEYCSAFYVDYVQTTYGVDYAFAIATEYKKGVRTLYVRDKTVGDEWVYVSDKDKTLEVYGRVSFDKAFVLEYSGDYSADEATDYRNSYEHLLLELERFMNPAEKGYSFIKMEDGYTDFGPCYVYNQITDGTADGIVYVDQSTGIMVKSRSHKKGDHTMEVLDYTFRKGQMPEYK